MKKFLSDPFNAICSFMALFMVIINFLYFYTSVDIETDTVIIINVIWGLFLFLCSFVFVDNILSKKQINGTRQQSRN